VNWVFGSVRRAYKNLPRSHRMRRGFPTATRLLFAIGKSGGVKHHSFGHERHVLTTALENMVMRGHEVVSTVGAELIPADKTFQKCPRIRSSDLFF